MQKANNLSRILATATLTCAEAPSPLIAPPKDPSSAKKPSKTANPPNAPIAFRPSPPPPAAAPKRQKPPPQSPPPSRTRPPVRAPPVRPNPRASAHIKRERASRRNSRLRPWWRLRMTAGRRCKETTKTRTRMGSRGIVIVIRSVMGRWSRAIWRGVRGSGSIWIASG